MPRTIKIKRITLKAVQARTNSIVTLGRLNLSTMTSRGKTRRKYNSSMSKNRNKRREEQN